MLKVTPSLSEEWQEASANTGDAVVCVCRLSNYGLQARLDAVKLSRFITVFF